MLLCDFVFTVNGETRRKQTNKHILTHMFAFTCTGAYTIVYSCIHSQFRAETFDRFRICDPYATVCTFMCMFASTKQIGTTVFCSSFKWFTLHYSHAIFFDGNSLAVSKFSKENPIKSISLNNCSKCQIH